jgi:hypothetical protein
MIKILFFLLISTFLAKAGPYTEIPKVFIKPDKHEKSLKIGYNLTNNLTQKQSLFFIEGNLKNDNINHTSRIDIATASTELNGIIKASSASQLFRTTTFKQLKQFGENPDSTNQSQKNSISLTGIAYGRFYNFNDKVTDTNDLKDQIATLGFGLSNLKNYTIGFSIGMRDADVFFSSNKKNISSYIYRPSISYNNSVRNIIPIFMKSFLMDYQIFDFVTETNLKLEYALIASYNTNIEQVYIGFEKSLSKYISIAIFYDVEKTISSFEDLQNKNIIEKISTSLVVKL